MHLVPYIEGHAQLIRGGKRMLDCDLKNVYGVETRELNYAYSRNLDKFEDGWVVELTDEEIETLRANKLLTINQMSRYKPKAYNLEACNMVAFCLSRSELARKRSVTIVNVFSDLERMAHGEL